MKKSSLIFMHERIFWYCLIIVQGILFALLSICAMEKKYPEAWANYGHNATSFTVNINNVSPEKQYDVYYYLTQVADSNSLFLIRHDYKIENDGSYNGQEFGIYGTTENYNPSFSFMGKEILSETDILKLLSSKEINSTIGLGKSSKTCLKPLPRYIFGKSIVISKLSTLFNETKTISGDYIIEGATNEQKSDIVNSLSEILNQPSDNILFAKRGFSIDGSLKMVLLFGLLSGGIVVGAIFLLIYTLNKLKIKGVLALQGWSNMDFAHEIYNKLLSFNLCMIPLFVIVTIIISGWINISIPNVMAFFIWGMAFFTVSLIEVGIASLLVFGVTPLNAIKKYYPTQLMYSIGIFVFLASNMISVVCCLYVDTPAKQLSQNMHLLRQWNEVENYCILSNINVGKDQESYSGQSNKLADDIFNWYSDICNIDGVYLINTTFYNDDILDQWRNYNIYTSIPTNSFWYFAMSPNYLNESITNVSTDVIEEAITGTMVYLIPSSYSDSEKENIKNWLKESTLQGMSDADIETTFKQKRQFKFITYDIDDEYFTWATNANEKSNCINPIIYICTPENTTYFENESFRAKGFDGYIKFKNKDIASKCLANISKYSLSDNNILVESVGSYIDGIQKNLKQVISWFALFYVGLIVILVLIMITLAMIFSTSHRELIAVKILLGFSFTRIYKSLYIFLVGVSILDLSIIVTSKSRLGMVFFLFYQLILWLVFFNFLAKKDTFSFANKINEE